MKEMLTKFKEWWVHLAAREKRTLSIGASAVMVFIAYQWIWSPLIDHAADLRKRIYNGQKTLAWMQSTDQTIKKIENQGQQQKKSLTPVLLLGILQKQINESGLDQSLTQLKQNGNDAIAMRFQKVEFDKMMRFLIAVLKEQSVAITHFSAKTTGTPGIVNAELQLKLG